MQDVEIPNSPRFLKVAELAELMKITAHDLRDGGAEPYSLPKATLSGIDQSYCNGPSTCELT